MPLQSLQRVMHRLVIRFIHPHPALNPPPHHPIPSLWIVVYVDTPNWNGTWHQLMMKTLRVPMSVYLSACLSVRPSIHHSIRRSVAPVLRSASLARSSSSSNEAFKERHHCSYILTRDCISWHYLSSTTAHPHSPITCFTFIDWPSSSDSVYVKHFFNHLLSFFFFSPTSFIIADPAGRKFQGPRHPFFRSCLTHEPMHMHITPMRLNACRSSRLTYFSPRFHTWPISPKV